MRQRLWRCGAGAIRKAHANARLILVRYRHNHANTRVTAQESIIMKSNLYLAAAVAALSLAAAGSALANDSDELWYRSS